MRNSAFGYNETVCAKVNVCMQCSAEAAFLRHCHTNFEYDTAKTVQAGHLAYLDFWPVTGLGVRKLCEKSHAKNNFVFMLWQMMRPQNACPKK